MIKGFRRRLKGRTALLFFERHRHRCLLERNRRKNRKRKNKYFPHFYVMKGEENLVQIVQGRNRDILVGNTSCKVPKGSLIITLPEVFDFYKNYEESIKVIAIFRRALESNRRISYINFERLKEISPACIMVFSAYTDMWKTQAPKINVKTQTWDPIVAQKFSEIGFFKMLGFKEPNIEAKKKSGQIFLPLFSRTISSYEGYDVGKEAGDLQKRIEDLLGVSLDGVRMYDSVSEAIRNIYDHAYKGLSNNRLPFKWWVSVAYNKFENELYVIIFDCGLGIPTTILSSSKFSIYHKFISMWSEGERLYLAFERDRRRRISSGVRSLLKGRGHGCPDIARLVSSKDENEVKDGSVLSVISGGGLYILNGNKEERGEKRDLKTKLQGTLIEWKIML